MRGRKYIPKPTAKRLNNQNKDFSSNEFRKVQKMWRAISKLLLVGTPKLIEILKFPNVMTRHFFCTVLAVRHFFVQG